MSPRLYLAFSGRDIPSTQCPTPLFPLLLTAIGRVIRQFTIRIVSSADYSLSAFYNENRWQKFTRRLKEEPLIPFGVGLTCWAFYNAAKSIRTGNGSRTNQFFRYRLYAQSFTLIAMIGGSFYYNADRLRRKEYLDLVDKRKAQEKRDAWIRELEARDQEDKDWREKLGMVRDSQREQREREALEEKNRREGRSDDGKGVIGALIGKMKDVEDEEADKEDAELEQRRELLKGKRQKREKKQEVERAKQEMVKLEAGMGPDTRIWGENGGGLFGWKRIRDWVNRPRSSGGEN